MQSSPKNEVMEGFENLDFNLMEATLASIQTQSLTPIIKEELRLKIQSNRLALGKQELPKPIFKEPEKFQLTDEELAKQHHRRELNRLAASKCRNKRKEKDQQTFKEKDDLEKKNKELQRRVETLETEKASVIGTLTSLNIPIPTWLMPLDFRTKLEPEEAPSAQSALSENIDLPSTSSGIYASSTFNRRFSAETYRPPPLYQPRRWSSEVPFSNYVEPGASNLSTFMYTSESEERIPMSSASGEFQNVHDQFIEEDEMTFLERQTFQANSLFRSSSAENNETPLHTLPQDYHYQDQQEQWDEKLGQPFTIEDDNKSENYEMNEEMKLIQQFFLPLPDDATVPGSDDSGNQCPLTPTFY